MTAVIAFLAIAAAMIAVVLVIVLRPLVRRTATGPAIEHASSNLQILRNQFAELETDRERGTLTDAQYVEAKAELERRVLDEPTGDGDGMKGQTLRGTPLLTGRWTAAALAVALPIAAALLYWQLGNPSMLAPGQDVARSAEHDVSPEQIQAMIARLVQRLEQTPEDTRGWAILARSYTAIQRYPDAARAFDRLVQLTPNDADALADYADALGMAQGRNLAGKPMELVRRALRLNPNHWKALAMAGSEAFDRRDYRGAIAYWEKLQAVVPPESPFGQSIGGSLDEARTLARMGGASPSAPATAQAAAATAAQTAVKAAVSLSPALAARASPDDVVFIFARPAQGPKMPLAVVRKQVKDLPAIVTLDDSLAMSAGTKLSAYKQVVVGARVSKGANAAPQSGDLEGLSAQVNVGATDVKVVIDKVLP